MLILTIVMWRGGGRRRKKTTHRRNVKLNTVRRCTAVLQKGRFLYRAFKLTLLKPPQAMKWYWLRFKIDQKHRIIKTAFLKNIFLPQKNPKWGKKSTAAYVSGDTTDAKWWMKPRVLTTPFFSQSARSGAYSNQSYLSESTRLTTTSVQPGKIRNSCSNMKPHRPIRTSESSSESEWVGQ